MGIFFGTDGIRGRFNDDLSLNVAYSCGNSLGSEKFGAKILIGRDTRSTGELITLGFACGAMNAGASVTDIGVCPTPGISFLTQKLGYDFGVVISASHNPAEFNGIKIFDKTGKKIGDKWEERLEKKFLKQTTVPFDMVGRFESKPALAHQYLDYLRGKFKLDLSGKKIVIDCSNGATSGFAKRVFDGLGAEITYLSNHPDGTNINKSCGALSTQNLQREVLRQGADMGFAFDGDGDRLIAVDENGQVVTGDMLLYMFAAFYQKLGKLCVPEVVGTRHTNRGVELALKELGIGLIRTDIGDKYVSAKLIERNLLIGGEQSGHIIVRDIMGTGDGLVSALLAAEIVCAENKKLSELTNITLFTQENLNVEVSDKLRVINSEKLSEITEKFEKTLGANGRLMIRISGTEPYIRIMVESKNELISKQIANEIAEVVRQIDSESNTCAE